MSKQVEASLKCPKCGTEHNTKLYRSLWIENPSNRSMVFDDRVNVFECSECKFSERLTFSLLCTNSEKGFAVWYEPVPDPDVDKDVADYKQHMGSTSYFARAPRIRDWEEFKGTIVDLEHSLATPNVEVSEEMNAALGQFVGEIAKEQKKEKGLLQYWQQSYLVRLFSFVSAAWALGVLLYVVIVEPYGSRMRHDDYDHMYMVMLIPPVFASVTTYVYRRFIKSN
jgi:hypothetical protein